MKALEVLWWVLLGCVVAAILIDHVRQAKRWWPDMATSAAMAAVVTLCAYGAVGGLS